LLSSAQLPAVPRSVSEAAMAILIRIGLPTIREGNIAPLIEVAQTKSRPKAVSQFKSVDR
jgi:hypothetical protein